MPTQTVPGSPTPIGWRNYLVAGLSLAAVLAVFFHKSFAPDQILFSNDGPLGAIHSQAGHMWSSLLGVWQGLNWIGVQSPNTALDISGFLLAACCDTSPDFGSVLCAKIYAPTGVFLLGLGAWFLFRQLRFQPWVCLLGGLAAALNTTAFSVACWGLPTWPLACAMNLFAISALVTPSIRNPAVKAALSGFAVGLGVMEGFDVGAILSVFTAAFAFLRGITVEKGSRKKVAEGFAVVAIMAICALLIAAQTVSSLVGTQVKGIVGTAQDEQTKLMRWDFATQFSLPKAETLRVIIPGLFGYRMPELYGESVQSANGSNYWGAVGQTPGVIQSRHSGMGFFAGVLVVTVAAFGIGQCFRKKNNPFGPGEQKQMWCWLALLVISMLLAWGRHAPFYRLVYSLPYFSAIRNPFKFMFPFCLALVILFGYGLEALCRLYLNKAPAKTKPWRDQIRNWWKNAPAFDKKWTSGSIIAVVASLLGWLVYASSKSDLIRHLQDAGFPDSQYPGLAADIAGFSIAEVGEFVVFLVLSVAWLTLVLGGVFSGARARWAGPAAGLLLVIDLARADVPWIVYYDYKDKYATNPIIDQLREKPYEKRVSAELMPLSQAFLLPGNAAGLYYAEWLQHHFQFYRIQSLDIIQMPREPEFDKAYMTALRPAPPALYTILNKLGLLDPKIAAGMASQLVDDGTAFRCGRLWQLTNTRYILAATSYLNDPLNSLIDPGQKRFRIVARFNLAAKPGVDQATRWEQLTAVSDTNGPLALFEFTGALPRAKLFNQWQVNTNDQETLQRLAGADFDPAQSVFVASELPKPGVAAGTNQPAGTVEIVRYEPKIVRLNTDATAPSVLLLNDRHDPNWQVSVDGKPDSLLRCNYLMRGVYLPPGRHVVEFRFQPPLAAFSLSLASLATGALLCGYLVATQKSAKPSADATATGVRPSKIADHKSR